MRKHLKLVVWLVPVVVLVCSSLVLSACNQKQQSKYKSDIKEDLGAIPDDVCLVNGQPLILGASTESDGGLTLIYVRQNGDIVALNWVTAPVTQKLKKGAEFYWTGGVCPASQ